MFVYKIINDIREAYYVDEKEITHILITEEAHKELEKEMSTLSTMPTPPVADKLYGLPVLVVKKMEPPYMLVKRVK